MVSILDRIINVFRKKNDKENKEKFKEGKKSLEYTGMEPLCMACNYPIHETQRKRKMDGRLMHQKCFKGIRKIVLNGGNIDGF